MVVVFLGDFDTPTPEVVACKTSWAGSSGTVTLPSSSSNPPWLNSFICNISWKRLICVRLYHHHYFYRDTITRQAASQGWRHLYGHETISYTPSDATPVFQDLGVIIISIIYFENKKTWIFSIFYLFPIKLDKNWTKLICSSTY